MERATKNFILNLKKQKREKSLLFLDNVKIIKDAVKNNSIKVECFLTSENNLPFDDLGYKTYHVDSKTIEMLSDTKTPQKVLCVAYHNQDVVVKPTGNFLVIDSLQDPGNVGTLIRSAVAFEFNEIYLIDCAKVSNEKVARSSMGAIFKAKLFEISKQTFLNEFKGKTLLCGELGGAPLSMEKLGFPLGVVVGNEGSGISKEVLALGKGVEIEMSKNVESLNAGVAGSILMSYCYNKFKNLKGENR